MSQLDATVPQVHYLTVMYSSTCFRHEDARNTSSCT